MYVVFSPTMDVHSLLSHRGCTHSSTATATVDVHSLLQQQPLWMYSLLSHCRCTQSSQPLWMYTVFYSNSNFGCTVFSATVDVHSLLSHCGCTQSSTATATVDVRRFLSHRTMDAHSLHSHCGCTQSSAATATVDVRSFLSYYGCTQSSQPLWMYTVFSDTVDVPSRL